MALPQDGQNANGLTKVTQIPAGKELMFIDPTTNEGGIITLEDLTKQILNGLASQAFALDAGQMTLLAALNKLNSDTLKANTINHKSFDLNDYTVTGLYDTRGTLPSTIGMKNYPTDITASIIVLSTTYIVTQIYIAHNAASLYLRCKYQGHEFSEWKSVQLI